MDKSRAQYYETFYSRNLRIFTQSYSVCPWQAFPAYSNKPSSLVRKLVTYGQKHFKALSPGERLSITLAYIAPAHLTKEKKFYRISTWLRPVNRLTGGKSWTNGVLALGCL